MDNGTPGGAAEGPPWYNRRPPYPAGSEMASGAPRLSGADVEIFVSGSPLPLAAGEEILQEEDINPQQTEQELVGNSQRDMQEVESNSPLDEQDEETVGWRNSQRQEEGEATNFHGEEGGGSAVPSAEMQAEMRLPYATGPLSGGTPPPHTPVILHPEDAVSPHLPPPPTPSVVAASAQSAVSADDFMLSPKRQKRHSDGSDGEDGGCKPFPL